MKIVIKQIVGLLVAGVILNVFCACNDTVDQMQEVPETGNKYDDAEEAENAVDALYREGAPTFYGRSALSEGPVAGWGGFLSGLFDNESKEETSLCGVSQHLTVNAVNASSAIERIWKDAYQAIYKANMAIDRIPHTEELSIEQRRVLVAEASFFRAFNYFYLVRCFGGVPLVRSSEVNPEASMLPRASVSEVYQLVVNDLQSSIDCLPDSAFTENHFRVSRTTVEMLLADVYLTMSGYPLQQSYCREAANMARRIIRSGRHRLTPNGSTEEESAYNVLRTEDRNSEYIYSYRIDERNADETLMVFSLPKEAMSWEVLKVNATNNAYMPTKEYLNVYDSVYDLRMHEQQFFYSFYKYEKKGKTIIQTFPQASYLWFHREGLQNTGVSDKDIPIYRYAETLLLAAEAIANVEGVTSEAVGYLADVRTRAYNSVARTEIINQLSVLNREKFIEQVWLERMREFPFEMKIWTDIQRTRKYPVTAVKEKGKATFVEVVGANNSWEAVFEKKHLLLPLSQEMVSDHPQWGQNPGYEE